MYHHLAQGDYTVVAQLLVLLLFIRSILMDQPNVIVGTPSKVLNLLQTRVGVCVYVL